MEMVSIYEPAEISKIRKLLGLSPTEFAYRLGVSTSAVSTWDKGTRNPHVDIHRKLTKMLEEAGLDPRKLFPASVIGPMVPSSPPQASAAASA